jgi:hypothetical protein
VRLTIDDGEGMEHTAPNLNGMNLAQQLPVVSVNPV